MRSSRPRTSPRRARRSAGSVTGLLVTGLLVTGCAGEPSTPEAGSQEATSSGETATVEWVRLTVPEGWVVLDAEQRPEGWDWAAQDVLGAGAQQQLSVDGDFGYYPSAGLALAALQAAPQLGSLPAFTQVGSVREVEIQGADDAEVLTFSYRGSDESPFEGAWIVACDRDTEKCGVVQVASNGELDDALVDEVVSGMTLQPGGGDDA